MTLDTGRGLLAWFIVACLVLSSQYALAAIVATFAAIIVYFIFGWLFLGFREILRLADHH